jgi:ferrous iron transport protein B
MLAPITVNWLGLPKISGILLLFGILRKELILIMLATLVGTTNFSLVLNPNQMIVLSLVSMFYIPCIATISALTKEFGIKRALQITIFEILFAIFLGGLVFKFLKII